MRSFDFFLEFILIVPNRGKYTNRAFGLGVRAWNRAWNNLHVTETTSRRDTGRVGRTYENRN